MEFPKRVYTADEVETAKELIREGHKHRLKIKGKPEFKQRIKEALGLIKTAQFYDFLRTYIRQIIEIDGFSQLRETESVIWLSKYAVEDPIEGAGFLIQKAHQMKDYIEGRLYYDKGEVNAVKKRVQFLQHLKTRSKNPTLKRKCEDRLKRWTETPFP
ncbi:MAG: hypothetical protein OEX77_07470 [Candidatus Bathyarchaeota archaeon]|nr:hypothetical protein [Candidatus Bathyarchaeota archaeon]MDH5732965.1 hypothetical protein [Candidatus Bathyarchaeota archaeon]